MNSKIIENEVEDHGEKASFFLLEIVLCFINSVLFYIKEKKILQNAKILITIIISILSIQELDESIIKNFENCLSKISGVLTPEEEEKKNILPNKLLLKHKISTNKKKLRKKKILSQHAKINHSKAVDKGATKIEKYFQPEKVKYRNNKKNSQSSNIDISKNLSIEKLPSNQFLPAKFSNKFYNNILNKKCTSETLNSNNDDYTNKNIPNLINDSNNNKHLGSYKSSKASVNNSCFNIADKLGKTTYSLIFENDSNQNPVSCSNANAYSNNSKLSFSKHPLKGIASIADKRSKEIEIKNNQEEISYQKFFKDVVKSRNYINTNSNSINNGNYNNLYGNGNKHKYKNLNYQYHSRSSREHSIDDMASIHSHPQNRKHSNVTFGHSSVIYNNNLSNSNILNSSLILNSSNHQNSNNSLASNMQANIDVNYNYNHSSDVYANANSNLLLKQNSVYISSCLNNNNDDNNSDNLYPSNDIYQMQSSTNLAETLHADLNALNPENIKEDNESLALSVANYPNKIIITDQSNNLNNQNNLLIKQNSQENYSKFSASTNCGATSDSNNYIKKPININVSSTNAEGSSSINYYTAKFLNSKNSIGELNALFNKNRSQQKNGNLNVKENNNNGYSLTSTPNWAVDSSVISKNNSNINANTTKYENITSFRKINLSFNNCENEILNSTMNLNSNLSLLNSSCNSNSNTFSNTNLFSKYCDSELKYKSKYVFGTGINNKLMNKITDLPKAKKFRNGSSHKKSRKNNTLERNKYIDMIYNILSVPSINKQNEDKQISNFNEKLKNVENESYFAHENINNSNNNKLKGNCDVNDLQFDNISNIDSKSLNYIYKENSKSSDANSSFMKKNKSVSSDKTNSLKEILNVSFYNKQILLKKSPQNSKSSNISGDTKIINEADKKVDDNLDKDELNDKEILCLQENISISNFNHDSNLNSFSDISRRNSTKINSNNTQEEGKRLSPVVAKSYEDIEEIQEKKNCSSINLSRDGKEITKNSFCDSLKKILNDNSSHITDYDHQRSHSMNKNSKEKIHENKSQILNSNTTCPTSSSAGISSIKTRSGKISILADNSVDNLLKKKRKCTRMNTNKNIYTNEFEENIENLNTVNSNKFEYKNKFNRMLNKNSMKTNEAESELCASKKRKLSINSRGRVSMASHTDDEILVYETPKKPQDFIDLKYSPNTISRKNLMDLFAQFKKN